MVSDRLGRMSESQRSQGRRQRMAQGGVERSCFGRQASGRGGARGRESVNRAGRMAWEGGESRTTGSGQKGRRSGERDRDD